MGQPNRLPSARGLFHSTKLWWSLTFIYFGCETLKAAPRHHHKAHAARTRRA